MEGPVIISRGYGVLFSGDTLFRENIGRSDLPTGNARQLVESIRSKLMLLEDQVVVIRDTMNRRPSGMRGITISI